MRQSYPGQELHLFARASNWKRYLAAQLTPHLHGSVLEVGAGMGATTAFLCRSSVIRWVCLEPDASLAAIIGAKIAGGELPPSCEARVGTTGQLPPALRFDAIVYIDVLEHIEADDRELDTVAGHLHPGGVLAVLSPAHPWLYSPFDAAIGHYRRYTRRTLQAAVPPHLECLALHYLDVGGLLPSLGNRLVLRRRQPSSGMVEAWDRYLVPVSRVLDPLFRFRLGRSILGVWRRPRHAARR